MTTETPKRAGPNLQLRCSDALAAQFRESAATRGLSQAAYLAELMERNGEKA